MTVIPRPLYSPDLALCYFFLFTKMKFKLKGRRFDSIIEAKTVAERDKDAETK
jgi:hypothetical protein